MEHNENDNKFCWSKNFPSPTSTLSPIPFVNSFQEIKENMPENTTFLTHSLHCIKDEDHLNL